MQPFGNQMVSRQMLCATLLHKKTRVLSYRTDIFSMDWKNMCLFEYSCLLANRQLSRSQTTVCGIIERLQQQPHTFLTRPFQRSIIIFLRALHVTMAAALQPGGVYRNRTVHRILGARTSKFEPTQSSRTMAQSQDIIRNLSRRVSHALGC